MVQCMYVLLWTLLRCVVQLKGGHVLAGIKILDKDAAHPRSKDVLFNCEPSIDSSNGGEGHIPMNY